MKNLVPISALLFFFGSWEWYSQQEPFFRLLFSSPSRVASFMFENRLTLGLDLLHTLLVSFFGLLLAVVMGVFLAVVGLSNARTAQNLEAWSTVAQSIPLIVFAPFSVMLLGVSVASKVALASIMAIFPIVLGFLSAIRSAQAEFRELADLHNVPRLSRIRELYLPYAAPNLIATLRISAALAILGAVIAEFTGSALGLGRNIFLGTVRIDPELIVSSLVLTSLLGVVVHMTLVSVERRISWWR